MDYHSLIHISHNKKYFPNGNAPTGWFYPVWLVVLTILKNMKVKWEGLSHILWKIKHVAMSQNPVPLVNPKIAGKWMFIPLKMVLIGIDPYPCSKPPTSCNISSAFSGFHFSIIPTFAAAMPPMNLPSTAPQVPKSPSRWSLNPKPHRKS